MNMNDIYENRQRFYLAPSGVGRMLIGLAILAGLGLMGFTYAKLGPQAFWGAYLFNLFYFFCFGLGAMAMCAIQDVIGAVWARPIKRMWEAFGAFVPVATVMFLIYMFCVFFNILGGGEMYAWMRDPHMLDHFWGKKDWLTSTGWLIRNIFILIAFSLMVLWQLRQSLHRDMLLLQGDRDGALSEGEKSRVRTNFWSGGLLVSYGVGLSFFGIDMIKSLSPLWFSTLWGGWQFAIMMQTLFAFSLIVMFALKGTAVGQVINRQQFHDCGKLMFGFTVFFAYTTFAHILTYWYGNMPEETEYFIHRLHDPWLSILITIFVIAFVIPLYSLIFKAAKWTAVITIPIASLILFGQWLTNMVLVMPEMGTYDDLFIVAALGGFMLFLGLFFTTFFWFAKRYPMVAIADPLLPDGMKLDTTH